MNTLDRRFNSAAGDYSAAWAAVAGGAAALELAGTGCSSRSAEAAAPGVLIVASDKNAVVNTAGVPLEPGRPRFGADYGAIVPNVS
jgi:hypothetical protein